MQRSFLPLVLHDPGPNDLDLVHRLVLRICFDKAHALDHPHPGLDSAEDGVLPVQPRCRRKGDEELAPVGIRPAICHAQNPSPSMFQLSVDLVLKLLAVDGASPPAGAGGIAGLDHEVGNDAMDNDIVVVASLGKGRKVLACLGIGRSAVFNC